MRSYMVIALLASGLVAAPVEAATYLITYTGTVSESHDDAGFFGPPHITLDGDAFKAVYTLTDPTPGAYTYNDGSLGETYGGYYYTTPSPMSGKLTINGVTRLFDGAYIAEADQENHFGDDSIDSIFDFVRFIGNNYHGILSNSISSYTNNIINSSNYTDPLHYTLKEGDTSSGHFRLYDDRLSYDVSGTLNAQTVDIALASAAGVPEPATWLMMIGGLGLAGLVIRRRRAAARFAVC